MSRSQCRPHLAGGAGRGVGVDPAAPDDLCPSQQSADKEIVLASSSGVGVRFRRHRDAPSTPGPRGVARYGADEVRQATGAVRRLPRARDRPGPGRPGPRRREADRRHVLARGHPLLPKDGGGKVRRRLYEPGWRCLSFRIALGAGVWEVGYLATQHLDATVQNTGELWWDNRAGPGDAGDRRDRRGLCADRGHRGVHGANPRAPGADARVGRHAARNPTHARPPLRR